MEWVFVVAVVVVLGAKVWLARNAYRRRRGRAQGHPHAGYVGREVPDHLPGHGTGGSGG